MAKKELRKREFEHIKGKNRELIKEVKRLKRLKSRTLEQNEDMDSSSDLIMEDLPNREKRQCPKCSGTETNVLELSHRSYLICQECGFRGPLK
jgi:predicted RNA-binding Zn-ribbon protein involved in translation (DUF1610 family)